VSGARLLLWRHGRTAANAGQRVQGHLDEPLDDVGRWQARTAAAALLAQHEPTAIVASDLVRARATADALARATGLPVGVDPRLRERSFGEWEGLTVTTIAERWPDEFALWRAGGDPDGVGVEARSAVAARMGAAVREHAVAAGVEGTLVVVTHGTAVAQAVADLLDLPAAWRGLVVPRNAHWAELVPARVDVAPGWRLVGYNLGPTGASRNWDEGPDDEADPSDDAAAGGPAGAGVPGGRD
jgi:probable phosphoglycerate mutase